MMETYDEIFKCLMDAILDKSSVEISYTNQRNETITRRIHPNRFELVKRRYGKMSRLCVAAFCETRKAERVFAIVRIHKLSK